MSVLITGGLSPEAYRLQRILDLKDPIFADESQIPQIPGSRSIVLPHHSSTSFIHETLKACLDNGIETIYSLKLREIIELSKARALFSEYGIQLMIPSDSWLTTHPGGQDHISESLAVIERGIWKAGSPLPDNSSLKGETGVFTWATKEEQMEYSLYVIRNAGL